MLPQIEYLEPRCVPSVAPGWNALEYQLVLAHGGCGPWLEMPVPDWLRHPVTME